MQAWLAVVLVLAAHVAEEASTDFLGFYNPLVLGLQSRIPWFPMPTFAFVPWLVGLCGLVLVLAALGPAVRRGSRGTRVMAWALSAIMFLNRSLKNPVVPGPSGDFWSRITSRGPPDGPLLRPVWRHPDRLTRPLWGSQAAWANASRRPRRSRLYAVCTTRATWKIFQRPT